MLIRTFDFECTGLPQEGKPTAIIQIGFTDVHVDGALIKVDRKTTEFLVNPFRANPSLVIETGAKATHHLIESDFDEVTMSPDQGLRMLSGEPGEVDAFACHNREHDGHYFGGGGRPIICTLRVARVVWPEAERHSNQFLRYFLDLPVDRERATPAHGAGPDSYVTAVLLAAIIAQGPTLSEMIDMTNGPRLVDVIPFGKHKGERFEDIPTKYLQFLHKDKPRDRDIRFTIEHHLDERGAL